jgi:hypothetical protein
MTKEVNLKANQPFFSSFHQKMSPLPGITKRQKKGSTILQIAVLQLFKKLIKHSLFSSQRLSIIL